MRKTLFVLLLAITLPLMAQDPPPEAVLQQVLGLTPTQVTAIQQANQSRGAAIQPLYQEMEKQEQSLNTAFVATTPDPLEVGKLVLGIRDLQRQIEQKHHDAQQAIMDVLTDAQREQVAQIRTVEAAMRAAQALHQIGL